MDDTNHAQRIAEAVDRVWTRMLVRYGAQWLRMWEGIDEALAKADWRRELACYATNLHAIRFALDNLPADFPPNVSQFRAICNRRPDRPQARLAAPAVNRELAAAAREVLKATMRVAV